jgi:hypothetical protein
VGGLGGGRIFAVICFCLNYMYNIVEGVDRSSHLCCKNVDVLEELNKL